MILLDKPTCSLNIPGYSRLFFILLNQCDSLIVGDDFFTSRSSALCHGWRAGKQHFVIYSFFLFFFENQNNSARCSKCFWFVIMFGVLDCISFLLEYNFRSGWKRKILLQEFLDCKVLINLFANWTQFRKFTNWKFSAKICTSLPMLPRGQMQRKHWLAFRYTI